MQRSRAMAGVQMDNVSRRGHKAKIPVLLFIEGIPACPHAAKSHPGRCGTCVCDSPMPRELAAAQRVKANFDSVLAVSY